MMTFGSLFTGGGGCDIGARLAGLTTLWGIERDERVCAVAQENGVPAICADVTAVDYTALPRVDVLHASPPCVSYSILNSRARETYHDTLLARGVVYAIREQRPLLFTLENVPQYGSSKSLQIVVTALTALVKSGYTYRVYNVLFSALGVPQTRRRLFLAASRDVPLPQTITPTRPGASWYDAIADLPIHWDLLKYNIDRRKQASAAKEIAEEMCIYKIPSSFNLVKRTRYEQMFTITGGIDRDTFIFYGNAWRKTTPTMWLRWQTFPDEYKLPEARQRAAKIIGNAVPPVGYAEILKQLIGTTQKMP